MKGSENRCKIVSMLLLSKLNFEYFNNAEFRVSINYIIYHIHIYYGVTYTDKQITFNIEYTVAYIFRIKDIFYL